MKNIEKNKKRYIFIGKTLFFPKERIICVGDLHLGYENSLRNQGIGLALGQFKEMIEELKTTFDYLKDKGMKATQIIFLGDIKHYFSYNPDEKKDFNELIRFLLKYFERQNIIFIRGNHEKNEKSGDYVDYYIVKDIAFIHGHRAFSEIYDKEINMVVMAHLHPTITLSDKANIKREKYKCFLVGRYNKKDFIIVPSFLSFTEGVSLSELEGEGFDFSIVPNSELDSFEAFVVQPIGENALSFGKLEDL